MIQPKMRSGAGEGSEAVEGKIKGDGADHPKIPVCTSGFTCTWVLNQCAGELGEVSEFFSENMVQVDKRALIWSNRSYVLVHHDEQR